MKKKKYDSSIVKCDVGWQPRVGSSTGIWGGDFLGTYPSEQKARKVLKVAGCKKPRIIKFK